MRRALVWLSLVVFTSIRCLVLGQNVGIGTPTPFTALHVANTLTLSGAGTDLPAFGGGVLYLSGGWGSPVSGRMVIGDGTGWRLQVASRAASINTDVFTITDQGQVGINSPSPIRRLEVNGMGGASISSTNDGVSTTDWIALNTGGSTGPRVVQGAFDGVPTLGGHNAALNAWTNLNLNPGGNVGIGTAAPTEKLDIEGNLRVAALVGSGTRMVTVSPTGVFSSTGLPTGDNLGNHIATQNVRLNNFWLSNDGGNEGIRVDDLGRVGVGSFFPNSQLEVNGVGGITATTTNPGSGVVDWIAINAGGMFGNRVVQGILNSNATIGAHNAALNAWAPLDINPGGAQVRVGGTASISQDFELAVVGDVFCDNLRGVKKYVVNGAKEGKLAYYYHSTNKILTINLEDETPTITHFLASVTHVNQTPSIYVSIHQNNAAICTNRHLFSVAEPAVMDTVGYLNTDLGCPGSANVNIEITVVYR